MTGNPLTCEPIVSLQRLRADNLVSGHITWGALVAADLVVVPGPAAPILDAGPFVVLLASTSLLDAAASGVVERIRPRSAEAVGRSAQPDDAILVLRLDHPSWHVPSGSALRARDLAVAVDREDSIWTALEVQGAVPQGTRNQRASHVLEAVDAWERTTWQGITTLTPRLVDTGDDVALKWCDWRPCRPPEPPIKP
jgi:hypothetical protein